MVTIRKSIRNHLPVTSRPGTPAVKELPKASSSHIADIIASRTTADRKPLVQGWHELLKNLLSQLAPYLRAGRLVTFRTLTAPERRFFEKLHQKVVVPPSVNAVYLSPSVRFQMMAHRPAEEPQRTADPSAEHSPDEGILLAGRTADLDIIVNALFAKPPFTAAIDVYDRGQLLAGYVYNTADECIADLSNVLQVHLQRKAG